MHHFDPPRHVEQHNRPEGMIALCRHDHDAADQGLYSVEELRAMKAKRYSADDVKANFPSWAKDKVLVRVGGNYVLDVNSILKVNGRSIVTMARNEAGMLDLSLDLSDIDGKTILRMQENVLELSANVHDFVAAAREQSVKLWLDDRDIGLDLRFARMSMSEIRRLLDEDAARSTKLVTDAIARIGRSDVLGKTNLLDAQVSTFANLLRELNDGDYFDGEDKLAVLDIANMSTFERGKRVRIRDGGLEAPMIAGNVLYRCRGFMNLLV